MNKANKNILKTVATMFFFAMTLSCGKTDSKPQSVELITDAGKQNTIFKNLVSLTENTIADGTKDSLAFLVLPVQASCPSCRRKTIDSILKYRDNLADRHFIIISSNGGRKTISSYFREENSEIPVIDNRLFLDSNNLALKYELYTNKPTMYYIVDRKAYKKVASIPSTIKNDLHEFFTGDNSSQ